MDVIDADTDLEQLMRRWHHTIEYATAAWAEYQSLRDALTAADDRVAAARERWQAADRQRQELRAAIAEIEEGELAPVS
ncbi:MAG: hypothetical protein AMXMBFR45_06460 [Gammaproteobacteria bacterium]|nr:hypothetical protein [Gammaproteobacteria bacterium]